jgi:tripartite-type tricarboxylate transporter receptor subunit TctC
MSMAEWRAALTAALVLALGTGATAQEFPSRPVRAISNQSAGGLSDIFMRALGEELHKRWGQPVIVENRPGGSQNIGVRACQEAAPDGYTICILYSDALVYNPHLFKSLPFDEKGVRPVTNLFYLIQTLLVNSSLRVKTVYELIAFSKDKPGTLSYLTAAPPLALYMEKLKEEKGADWVRVPFRGGGEAMNAVLSGSTPIALLGEGNVAEQIRAGTMTSLVMLNNLKSPNFPEVPTLSETGYKGPASRAWFGLFTPAAVPAGIVEKIWKDVAAVIASPEFRERHLSARSLVPAVNTPQEFASEIEANRREAAQVVKDAGLIPQ